MTLTPDTTLAELFAVLAKVPGRHLRLVYDRTHGWTATLDHPPTLATGRGPDPVEALRDAFGAYAAAERRDEERLTDLERARAIRARAYRRDRRSR